MKSSVNISSSVTKCNSILQSVLNLSPLEVMIYRLLVQEGPMRSDELASMINKNRSTAYRSLENLVACNVCRKNTRTLERGGKYYIYSAVPPSDVRENMQQCTDRWYKTVSEAIEGFPYED